MQILSNSRKQPRSKPRRLLVCSLGPSLCCRVWLRGVARVLLQSPWETRQVAVKCVSEVVLLRPVVAEWMLEDLQEVAEKVRGYTAQSMSRWCDVCVPSLGGFFIQAPADSTD